MRYLVKVFYDGSNYFGYQRQPEHLTIEGAIIKALQKTEYIKINFEVIKYEFTKRSFSYYFKFNNE